MKSKIERIDKFLIKIGITNDNKVINECMQLNCTDYIGKKFKAPQILKHMYAYDNSLLLDNGNNLIYCQYSLNHCISYLVCNTNQ